MEGLGRGGLRWLIGALETRLERMGDDTPSPESMSVDHDGSDQYNEIELQTIQSSDPTERLAKALELLLSAVRTEIADLKEHRVHNSARPAVTLPVEILSRIFETVCYELMHHIDTITGFQVPFFQQLISLCSVCHQWREVVLRDPILWSNIAFETYYYGEESEGTVDKASVIEQVATQLVRSASRPLSIYLKNEHSIDSEGIMPSILTELASAPRIYERIRIDGFKANTSRHVSRLYTTLDPPRLRDLVLNWNVPADDWHDMSPKLLDLSQCSGLCQLWLSYWGPIAHPPTFWSIQPPAVCNVTKLHLNGHIQVMSSTSLINSSEKLEMLTWIHWMVYPEETMATLPRITLPSCLRYLCLGGPVPLRAMQSMHAPDLVGLRVLANSEDDSRISTAQAMIWDGLHPFSNISLFPKIRTLEVDDCEDAQSFALFVLAHRDLEEIALEFNIDEHLVACFSAVAETTPSEFVLSELTAVHARCHYDSLDHVNELLRLRAQLRPKSHLLVLSLNVDQMSAEEEWQERDDPRLQAVVDAYPGQIEPEDEWTTLADWDWNHLV